MQFLAAYRLGLLFCMIPFSLLAQMPSGYEVRGQAEFWYFGLKLYDAQLYTPRAGAFSWDRNFALEITYARRFSQKALVKSTINEIERVGRNSPNAAIWNGCFRTVQKGQKYLAIARGQNRVDFILNGQKTCRLEFAGIKRSFMGIFLGENTRSAKFTQKLRGG